MARQADEQPVLGGEGRPKCETVEVGRTVTLGTTTQTATAWQWRFIRKPTGSKAELSDPSGSNPTFTADVADVYVLELLATNASGHASLRQLQVLARSAVPVRISAFSWTGQECTVILDSDLGRYYTLEHADSLASPSWEGGLAVPGNGSTFILSDPAAASTRRFYRVRVE